MVAVLLLLLCFYSASCDSLPDTVTSVPILCTDWSDEICLKMLSECKETCGCDGFFKYDMTKGECVVNIEYLKEVTRTMDKLSEEKLNKENDRIFRGLIGSAIFVMCCATACVIAVCISCCRMHYSDRKLKSDIKALSKKLERYDKQGLIKPRQKKFMDKIEESCNIVVADTDIMCL